MYIQKVTLCMKSTKQTKIYREEKTNKQTNKAKTKEKDN